MKRRSILVCALIFSFPFILSACESPETDSTETQPSIETDTLDRIFSDTESLRALSFDNLDLSNVRICEKPERAAKIRWQVDDDFNENMETLFADFIGDRYDPACFTPDEGQWYPNGPSYIDLNQGVHMNMGLTGFLAFWDFSSLSDFKGSPQEYEEKYIDHETEQSFFLFEQYEDAAFQTVDGSVRVSEAAEAAERYAMDKWQKYEPGFGWHAKVVLVSPYDNGLHSFRVVMEKNYGGCPYPPPSSDLIVKTQKIMSRCSRGK